MNIHSQRNSLFDRMQGMAHRNFEELVNEYGGAFYLVSPETVSSNVSRLLGTMRSVYQNSNVAYSYKTNYNSTLIEAASKAGALSEVVSLDELAYARSLGVDDKRIIFNGPGKTRKVISDALMKPLTMIVDSIQELAVCAELSKSATISARIGIRVSPRLQFMSTDSRFGIDLEDIDQAKNVIEIIESSNLVISGLHLHHSGSRSVTSFLQRLRYLKSIASQIGLSEITFIDIGGGIASGMPEELKSRLSYSVDTLEAYAREIALAMVEEFSDCGTEVIVEPGTGVLADAGVFVTPVISTKKVRGRSFAVVDGTLFSVDPLRSPVEPLIHRFKTPLKSEEHTVVSQVTIGGNSCMEIDVIHSSFGQNLCVGDVLMIAQKGAYAACMSAPFIQGVPAVVSVSDQNEFTLLRGRTGYKLIGMLNRPTFCEKPS